MTNKKVPMRQCVGCGEMKSKKELLRVIKTPEEEIVLDTTGRKSARRLRTPSNRGFLQGNPRSPTEPTEEIKQCVLEES